MKRATLKEFNDKLKSHQYTSSYVENDTAVFGKLWRFENYGKLSPQKFYAVKKHLELISNKPLDTNKIIVINYISLLHNKYGKLYIFDTSTWKSMEKVNKIQDINLYHIMPIHNFKYIKGFNKKINWLIDNDNIIRDSFLEYDCAIGSFIVLRPDGAFCAYYCIEAQHDKLDEIVLNILQPKK